MLTNNENLNIINFKGNVNNNIVLFALEKLKDNKNFIIVVDNKNLAEQYYDFLKFTMNASVVNFSSFNNEPYNFILPSVIDCGKRLQALDYIKNSDKPLIIITDIAGLLQKFNTSFFKLNFKIGEKFNFENLAKELIQNGYKRVSEVITSGDFCIRGDIIDIFPSNNENPYRIEFFGNEIDKIKTFNQFNQLSIDTVESFDLYGVGDVILNDTTVDNFKKNYLKNLKDKNLNHISTSASRDIYNQVDIKNYSLSFLNYLPLFENYELNSLFDILKSDTEIFINSSFDFYLSEIFKLIDLNKKAFNIDIKNNDLFLNENQLKKHLEKLKIYTANPLLKTSLDFVCREFNECEKNRILGTEHLFEYLKNMSLNQSVIFNCSSDKLIEEIKKYFNINVVDTDITEGGKKNLLGKSFILKNNFFNSSFYFNNLLFISENNLTGNQKKQVYKNLSKQKKGNVITDFKDVEIDDYLVHFEHGIGQYKGIKNLNLNGKIHDLIELQYHNSKLFIPVESLDMLSKYGSKEMAVTLDTIGTGAWQMRKAKLKNKLKDLAEKLVKVAAKRFLAVLPEFKIEVTEYKQFLNDFPYIDTPDQATVTAEIEEDFKKGFPSDRLLCGDVGFGKTEIAARAAFLNVFNGKQVALICPTTLLCEQHFQTFINRFKSFPYIKIEKLSRFVTYNKAKKIKQDLKDGKVDIIIGTHALLNKNIEFLDLGLIVIDEEQAFGVVHKERLKNDYFNSHILTLSATPIPRTLSASFSGLKDLSILTTPPIDRIPIITQIVPFETSVIKSAIILELARGGQAFFVAPRIADLDIIYKKIKEILPEVKVAIAHGQMVPSKMEEIMTDFALQKYDVLLSTSIIESGLDLEKANTIFVFRADMFGLSSLYQLRGRVGRREKQAYCFLSYINEDILSPLALKRMELINSLSSLGDNFKLASHDLDIRGAGNLLGEEQSGFIKEVGVELYQKMLEEQVIKLKNKMQGIVLDNEDNFNVKIKTNKDFLIPEKYVENSSLRFNLYQRLSVSETIEQLNQMKNEFLDRFGKIPAQTENLFKIFQYKIILKNLKVEACEINNNIASVSFYKNKPMNPERIFMKLDKFKNVKILPPASVIFTSKSNDAFVILDEIIAFLQD